MRSPSPLLNQVVDPDGLALAEWIPDERRLAWSIGVAPDLERRLDAERERFDDIATWRREQLTREAPGPWTQSPSLDRGEVALLLERHPDLLDVKDATVLDVGGTAPVSWRFLAAGARALHQVDVSPDSQRVALERCALHGVADERLFFHTAPAEALPFRDACFDLVFSRNSIHHTARPAAWRELARVLRRGGRLVVFEPMLNRALRPLVMGRRRFLRIDRGTDDPLHHEDHQTLHHLFHDVDIVRYGAGATALVWALHRIRPLHPALKLVIRAEPHLARRPAVGRLLGVHGWVVAKR